MKIFSKLQHKCEIYVVISPGRSGTVGLHLALNQIEEFRSFHHLPAVFSSQIITEFFIRMMSGKFRDFTDAERNQGSFQYYVDVYIRNRAIELLQSIFSKKIAIVNHWDTYLVPIILYIFRNAKIIFQGMVFE